MNNEDHFEVLRKIGKKPNSTQRELADELGFSLGKLNYCIKATKKGLVKIENFKKTRKNKLFLYPYSCWNSRKNKINYKLYEKKNERVR